jgi:fibronectin type 3 domain-containing protein
MKHLHIFICLVLLSVGAGANPLNFIPAASSAQGNYIYLLQTEAYAKSPDILKHTEGFLIERVPFDTLNRSRDTGFSKAGEARPVGSVKELRRLFPEPQRAEMIKAFGLSDDDALVTYFQQHREVADYSLYYTAIETRVAAGHVYFDADVKPGRILFYRVTRLDKDGSRELWGYSIIRSRSGNYALPYYKPVLTETKVYDSAVFLTWKLPVGKAIRDAIPVPRSSLKGDEAGIVYQLPFDPSGLSMTLYSRNGGDNWQQGKTLLPQSNEAGDTLTYTFMRRTRPDEEIETFVLPQDELHNSGASSDTVRTYAITYRNAPLIYGIRVADIENGVRVAWDKLPTKPYLSSVVVARTNSDNKTDTLAVLSPGDTTYTDYAVEPGPQYTYKVWVEFLPQLGFRQEAPAMGIGAMTKFSAPSPPYDLKAANEGRNIRVSWEAQNGAGMYGYYVYRGTSPKNISLIAGPVKTKTFLDTATALSGRSTYYYGIMAQNLRQDTSLMSEITSIMPNRVITTTNPTAVSLYYVNSSLQISWDDVRTYDAAVAGYILQRKEGKTGVFRTLTPTVLQKAITSDSSLERGQTYAYRVAALSTHGDTSAFSDASEYTVAPKAIDIVSNYTLRNTSAGVILSWPPVEVEGRKAYNIYRRRSDSEAFSRIGTVGADAFSYTDEDVQADTIYVYTMAVVAPDDREGDRGGSKSIKRTATPKPTVIN